MLDLELMSSNVLKMSITPYAPKNYEYDFELSTLNYDNKSFNLEYNYDFILNIFKKHLFLKNEKILEIITRKYYNYYYNINVRLIESISKIDKVIKQYRIKKIFLTGFPGTTTSVIAKYFISKNINVVLRHHGEISAPYWPLQCYVKGVEFSTISNFYKSSLIKFTNNITITPRYYINPIEISKKKINNKRILITNDLFFNPQNKLLFINFFKSFITNINHKYNITLRSHPRYFGDLLPGFINNELKFENSREVDLVDSLNDCSLFIMPADTFSSIIASAIRFEIPSVIIAPLSSISVYNFEPYYFNYPFIINNENSLFDFIHKVENNISFKEEVILIQKKWLNSILEEKSIKKDHKLIHRNIKSTFNNKISYTIYYKLYIKNLLKFLYLIFST